MKRIIKVSSSLAEFYLYTLNYLTHVIFSAVNKNQHSSVDCQMVTGRGEYSFYSVSKPKRKTVQIQFPCIHSWDCFTWL